jgi:hypothetical protein
VISDVILGQPKKAASLVFLIFGYILASYIVSPIDLVFEQKVPAVIVAGGVFSAFLFYLKPVDLSMKTYLTIRNYIRKKHMVAEVASKPGIDAENFDLQQYLFHVDLIPPNLLNSSLVADEMANINGAVFFSISLLLASQLLSLINLYVPFELLVILAILMLIIAFWEGKSLINLKLPIINFYYRLHRLGEPSIELNKAINNKEWLLATQLMTNIFEKESRLCEKIVSYIFSPYDYTVYTSFAVYQSKPEGGICPKCATIVKRPEAENCPKCGLSLLKTCPACEANISVETIEGTPNYCIYCGQLLIPSPKNDGQNNSPKKN